MFHLYGLFIGMAMVAGWSVAEKIEPKVNQVVLPVLIFGFVGARLYHVIDLWDYYVQNLGMVVAVWNGGLGIWGGVIGGGVGLFLFKQTNKLTSIWDMLGAIVTGLPLAQAIGRIGNGVNGEFVNKFLGLPWWSIESILDLALFVLMWRLRGLSSQVRVGTYLMGYGLIRFVLEFGRINNWRVSGLGVAQWVGLASVVIGLLICQFKRVRD